ncbi:protein CBFA2T3 [Thrips palmi]|uniref:Protein CBFA2T3 n=1 Tax=Thrips palmi TaxID=161013 RepID=A0A6P8YQ25_THRPL|nr:protein CBFA2T3 [Thrips palmi]
MGKKLNCKACLLNGGSPGPGPDRHDRHDRHAGGASPPGQPLALSLSLWDRERSGRDGRDGRDGSGSAAGATPGATPGAAAATAAGTAFSSASAARSHAKMKRFLSTLVQFGSDISADTGERVRALVFSLVANGLSVEEFQHSLQEVTNFPLRGFVLPFLRGQLPALQRELHGLAKASGESALQYLRHHEHLLLDPASVSPAGEGVLNIFHADGKDAAKRPASDSLEEAEEAENLSAWAKRAHTSLDRTDRDRAVDRPVERPERTERALVRGGGVVHPRARHIPPPPHLQAQLHPQHPAQHAKEAEERRNNEDEWKNINVMLNCVLSMVEKTKHALVILQQRSTVPADGAAHENGVVALTAAGAAGAAVVSRQIKAAVDDIMARTLQDTEERIAELKRRAEETVNEVRRQAVLEIQRAVAAAEAQAAELMAAERVNLERRLDAVAAVAHNGHSPPADRLAHTANNCWNCGRKAQETCSGCNVARYCGSFCQHKDWETHHQVCALRGAAVQMEMKHCLTFPLYDCFNLINVRL